jgi:hypothetical protein
MNRMTIENLSTFSRNDWVLFFRRRLEQIYSENADEALRGLSFGHFGIYSPDNPAEAFRMLYDKLGSDDLDQTSTRRHFRCALGETLLGYMHDDLPERGAADLIEVIAATDAVESLDAMIDAFGRVESSASSKNGLLFTALSALVSLRHRSDAARAIERLVSYPTFPSHFVFDAYRVFLSSSPSMWARFFLSQRELFERAAHFDAPFDSESYVSWFDYRVALTVQLLARLSIVDLVNGLELIERELPSEALDEDKIAGMLLAGLLGQAESPYEFSSESNSIRSGQSGASASFDDLSSIELFLASTAPAAITQHSYRVGKRIESIRSKLSSIGADATLIVQADALHKTVGLHLRDAANEPAFAYAQMRN